MRITLFAFIALFSLSNPLLAEPINENQLDKLLIASGLASDLDSMPEMFASTLHEAKAQNININDQQVEALTTLINKIISPSFFKSHIKRELVTDLTQNDLVNLLTWYESDVGREITLAEELASSDEAYIEMANNTQTIMENTALVSRAKQIDIAMNASQQLYAITKNIGITMYAATSKINKPSVTVNITDFSAVLESQKTAVLQSIEDQITLFISYSLQKVDDVKIQQYIAFLNSSSGKKFVNGSISGLNTAFAQSMQTFVEAVNLLFEEEEWQLAEFLTFSVLEEQDLTLQKFPQLEIDEITLAAWSGDELNFFYNIAQQNNTLSTEEFWSSFKEQLKTSADEHKIDLIHEAKFVTQQGANVEFKIYIWAEDGEAYAQVANLVYNGKYRYLMQAFPLDITDLDATSVRNIKIMQAVKLAN